MLFYKVVLALLIFLSISNLYAVPYNGMPTTISQPDGTKIQALMYGDEFTQHFETMAGYSICKNPETKTYYYATLSADGTKLNATDIPADKKVPAYLNKHNRISSAAIKAEALINRQFFAQKSVELNLANQIIVSPNESNMQTGPINGAPCYGSVTGITIVIDFPDIPGTVATEDVRKFCNEPHWPGYGGVQQGGYQGSVRDFFRDVSEGKLDYTCHVPVLYFRAPQESKYYVDGGYNTIPPLVTAALQWLEDQGHDFSVHDNNGDGRMDAVNVFYSGAVQGGGLWPHSWRAINFHADGLYADRYQISGMMEGNKTLGAGTFCHENGHMLCYFPDLYDYDGDSAGVGKYCNMCSGGYETCPPLKYLAGWCDITELTESREGLTAVGGTNQYYTFTNPNNSKELYLIANQQLIGREAGSLKDTGLSIWHMDWKNGSNNNQDMTADRHYYVTLVQADNRWDLENNRDQGDDKDFFDASDKDEFGPSTSPNSDWWSGEASNLKIRNISENATVMTFDFIDMDFAPPTQLVASDGAFTNKTTLTWSPCVSADEYCVFRATFDDFNLATDVSGLINSNSFVDYKIVPGVTYYYWVKGFKGSNWSDFSNCAIGSADDGILIGYEGFDYATDSELIGQGTGFGWSNEWALIYPTSAQTNHIMAESLEYSDGELELETSGGALLLKTPTHWQAIARDLRSSVGHDNSQLWMSYLFRANTVASQSFYLWPSSSSTDTGAAIGFRDSTNFRFLAGEPSSVSPIQGQTYLVVARYDFMVGDDKAWFWLNPALADAPSTNNATSHINTTLAVGPKIRFTMVGGTGEYEYDELRFGNSFAEVTPFVPEPATFSIFLLGFWLLAKKRNS